MTLQISVVICNEILGVLIQQSIESRADRCKIVHLPVMRKGLLDFGLGRPTQHPPHLCRHLFGTMMRCWIPLRLLQSWNSWQTITRPLSQPVSQHHLPPQPLFFDHLLLRQPRQPCSVSLTLLREMLVGCSPIDPGVERPWLRTKNKPWYLRILLS